MDGLMALSPRDRRFLFLAVEVEPPYCVAVHELHSDDIELGRKQNRRHLKMLKQCRESGVWPGYPPVIHSISMPAWAHRDGNMVE